MPDPGRKTITVVLPAYNEAANLPMAIQAVEAALAGEELSILVVDDGSEDATCEVLERLSQEDPRVRYVSFSRNFGHQIALKAGYDLAESDCVITMDADMQHPAAVLPLLVSRWREGWDVVYTVRQEDQTLAPLKRRTSRLFYKVLNSITDIRLEPGSADFRLLDRKVVEVCRNLHEGSFFWRGLISWMGFSQTSISYVPEKRLHGVSKYSIRKMCNLALNGILGFSILPIRIASLLGLCSLGLSLIYFFYVICMTMAGNILPGWPSLIVSILFLGGVQLLCLGIIGEYIGKIYLGVKNRPAYLLKKTL